MRIGRRSTVSRGLLLAASLGSAAPALAGDTPPQAADAGTRVRSEGDAAMERLKQSIARKKQIGTSLPAPTLPANPDASSQHRAFDGLARLKTDPAMSKRVEADVIAARAALAAEREAASKRIAQALGLDAPETAALAGAAPSPKAAVWTPVLMVSSSMPVATLRTYAIQLERAGGVMAFRGMPGGMTRVAPMAKLSAQILRIDPGCEGPACAMRNVQIIVDPILFRQHAVAQVPALAMIPGDPAQPYCERDETSPHSAHVIYGDAALSGLLDEYARLGGKEEVRDAQSRLARR
jgi:type-F conjugative transfer system pilin assembly protein TrbC